VSLILLTIYSLGESCCFRQFKIVHNSAFAVVTLWQFLGFSVDHSNGSRDGGQGRRCF
jgi:hypothetical protein